MKLQHVKRPSYALALIFLLRRLNLYKSSSNFTSAIAVRHSDNSLLARNEVYLSPGSTLDHSVCLKVADKYIITYYGIWKLTGE